MLPSTSTNVQHFIIDVRISKGFPRFVNSLSSSQPSIPLEVQHASCESQIRPFKILEFDDNAVFNASGSLWKQVNPGADYIMLANEANIRNAVFIFLTDLKYALQLKLSLEVEVLISKIRPDIIVLSMDHIIVGVVEVKKWGTDINNRDAILLQPTVLGELFDQITLAEGFYGVGPICGMLTDGESTLLAWLPKDDEYFAGSPPSSQILSTSSFSTPFKSRPTVESSPPGNTPSKIKGTPHKICVDTSIDDTEIEVKENVRLLSRTEIVDGRINFDNLVRLLCSALIRMSHAKPNYHANNCKILLTFHLEQPLITWFTPTAEFMENIKPHKFPRRHTKKLIALEDLGTGATGKAYLCGTAYQEGSAICVLKFHHTKKNDHSLEIELKAWKDVYPEFETMVNVRVWSSNHALMMPHFPSYTTDERGNHDIKKQIHDLLKKKFFSKKLCHPDVKWRNLGKFTDKNNFTVPILFDLVGLTICKDASWIDTAMSHLFPEGPLSNFASLKVGILD